MSTSGTANLLTLTGRIVKYADELHERGLPRNQADYVSCCIVNPEAKNSADAIRQAYAGEHHNELFTDHLTTVKSNDHYCFLSARNCSSSASTVATSGRAIFSYGAAVVKLPK